ncbi:hypothetical protein BDZ85DRAFT_187943 [Elsinoe ampelina]|uniref:Rhodopsin domain-containing protein n=1 Tax=Elsinoe ampelina TaxID=302913 RepID=A0A6A6GR63_9PEZI|nr:hypothetical protein BDZ85DRAFT_187943 [Elsinoe ampelina]
MRAAQLVARQGPPPTPGPPRSAEYLAESHASNILGLIGFFTVAIIITMILRLYVRKVLLKSVGSDDIVMAVATVCAVGVFAGFCAQVQYGLGRHTEVIDLDMQQGFQRVQFPVSLFTTTGVTLTKISIALLLMRLVTDSRVIIFLWCFIALISSYTLASDLTIVLACIPVNAQWNFALMSTAKCFPISTFTNLGLANSVVTIATDLILALLPMPIVWKLHADIRTKIALMAVLALGLIACAAGAVKVYYQLTFLSQPDRFYNNSFPVWGALEICIAILAGNLPTLKPLFSNFFAEISSAVKYGSRTGGPSRNTKINENASRVNASAVRNVESPPSDDGQIASKEFDAGVIVEEITITQTKA